jgi:hypothetical protein
MYCTEYGLLFPDPYIGNALLCSVPCTVRDTVSDVNRRAFFSHKPDLQGHFNVKSEESLRNLHTSNDLSPGVKLLQPRQNKSKYLVRQSLYALLLLRKKKGYGAP